MNTHEIYMKRCLDLANKGAGYVAPNPMVGAVIVHKDKIIGEGFHEKYGQAHAEVNAVRSVENNDLLNEATIYVNLEPCAHFGKTPPCSDMIISNNIPKVVIGCVDPFSKVAGKGIEKMKNAGIEVELGVLEKECIELNKRFFTFHQKHRPYIILKWAQSKNGFIDIDRKNNQKGVFWITSKETKAIVHKWRHEEAALLVGKNTISNDDPELTVREIQGVSPTRIVIDENLRLDYPAFKVGDRSVKTIVLTKKNIRSGPNLDFIKPENFEISGIIKTLYDLDIQSILVECGKNTLQRFIDSGLWDEARILEGNTEIKKGLSAPEIQGEIKSEYFIGTDKVKILIND